MNAPPNTLVGTLWHLFKKVSYAAFAPHLLLVNLTVGFGLWLAHTYALVVLNEGYRASDPLLAEILVLPDRWVVASAKWVMLGYVVGHFFPRGLLHPVRTVSNLVGAPRTLTRAVSGLGPTTLFLLPLGACLGMALAAVLWDPLLRTLVLIALFLSVAAGRAGLAVSLLRAGAHDLSGLVGVDSRFADAGWQVFVGGVLAGLLATLWLPAPPWGPLFAMFTALALSITGLSLRLVRGLPAASLLLAALAWSWVAQADDGGWIEAGGTLADWLTSDGAALAALLGLAPGIGGIGGWILGSVLADLGLAPVPAPQPPAESETEEKDEEKPAVKIRIERIYPESPHVLTKGFTYRAVIEAPPDAAPSEVTWSAANAKFSPASTRSGQWTRVSFSHPGRHTLRASVLVDGETHEVTASDYAEWAARYARVGDKSRCNACAHGCPACPHPTIGPIIVGSPSFFIDGLPIARVGDHGIAAICCGQNRFVILDGDPNVLIDGRRAARHDDPTAHCGGLGKIL